MTLEDQKKYFEFLHEFRTNTLRFMPNSQHRSSRIQLDLLIYLALHVNENLTIKQLLASVPHSDAGIRIHFEILLNDQFIELQESSHDRRVRYVKPTKKLEKIFATWAESGTKLIKDSYF